jgi:demethylmenaquinone methyltransferase/2-methoxy-6-polyprenyl-1,4-benzoquinol methylase
MTTPSGNAVARELFAPLGPTYDRYARLLSLGQDPRWRRFLVSRVPVGPSDTVLDVASGTAAVAIELARRTGCTVVGLDQSREMLAAGRRRVEQAGLKDRVRLVRGNAEQLPFQDATFDAVTFTYLLRYVDDREATMRELVRVTRAGGTVAALEFGVPPAPLWGGLWELYVRLVLPVAGRAISAGWGDVGRFLGPSIRALPPPENLAEVWWDSGLRDVRFRRLSFGGGVVLWGRRE